METTTIKTMLRDVFRKAADAAIASDPGPELDGGTCNTDTPAFRIDGVRAKTIEQAASDAGIRVMQFRWFGGKRWWWLMVPMNGQGNRRSAMMSAAQKVLNDAKSYVPNMHACGYQAMD